MQLRIPKRTCKEISLVTTALFHYSQCGQIYIYIYKRTCKLRHILVVRTCWWIDPNAIHHSKCLPTYQSPLLLFESDITKLIIIYRMNRRCEIYVSRIRHFHGTSRKVTCNQRTLALISLFHPSSNGMMFGTLVPFGFARATFDIVSSGMKIRIFVLFIVVGAAHFCGLWYEHEI